MMSKAEVLFFAADPLSAPPDGGDPRLLLDEDMRQIRKKVRAAPYAKGLEFDCHWAARVDDMVEALEETRPRVVHFSGHGTTEGLMVVGDDGSPHLVDAAVLVELFEEFRGDIRLVVLNACLSQPQAKEIAELVGCAIGTPGEISDAAAITFGAYFYRSLAYGRSVQAAYRRARLMLRLKHGPAEVCPELVVRPGVDPAQIVLVRPPWPYRRVTKAAAVLAATTGAALVLTSVTSSPRKESSDEATLSALFCSSGSSTRGVVSGQAGNAAAGGLADARSLYHAGSYEAALPHFKRLALTGDPEATGYLGIMHLHGQGTIRDSSVGVLWLHKAAAARDPRGMTGLALAYQRGEGVTRSYRWAKHWYHVAADKGYPPAMRDLGMLYLTRPEVDSTYRQALGWVQRAADEGCLDAMVDAGYIYAKGLGTPRNLPEAFRRYRAAAEVGFTRGMVALGLAYQEGVGTPQDFVQARAWYLRAARSGSPDAMNNLGLLYQNGWGVEASRAKAAGWFRRAAKRGSEVAKGNLDALARAD